MSKKVIALTDTEDQVRYFDEESLMSQLAGADIPGSAPIKSAYRNLANKVNEMRRCQNQYFAAAYGSPEKASMLKRSKEAEKKVDDIVKQFNVVLEKM